MDETYRLEDHFCPACLSGHRAPCNGFDYWCECLCVAEHEDVVKARRALRVPGVRLHQEESP